MGTWDKLRRDPKNEWARIGFYAYRNWQSYDDMCRDFQLVKYAPGLKKMLRFATWCGDRASKYGNLPMESTWPRYDLASAGTHGSLKRPAPKQTPTPNPATFPARMAALGIAPKVWDRATQRYVYGPLNI